jgi:heterodisulfide reductase subunit B
MTMRYAFFKGCLIPAKLPHLEALAQKIFPELGIELVDIPGFSCCPDPINFSGADQLTWMTIAARNLCLAEEKGLDIITLCNGCVNTLAQARHALVHTPELREKVNEMLADTGHQFEGRVEVRHFLKVFYEDIGLDTLKKLVKKDLSGLKVATHTGCHLFSPHEVMHFDNPADPFVLDEMVAALGAEAVDYDLKSQCCGSSLILSGKQQGSSKLLEDKLTRMKEQKADCIAVVCPFCYQQFDLGQLMAARKLKLDFSIPVLFYLQLLGLAMGLTLKDVHYDTHKIKGASLEAVCKES